MNYTSQTALVTPEKAHVDQVSNAEAYIFNDKNLVHYEVGAMQGLSVLHRAIRHADTPFSGITPSQAAEQVSKVDLEQPLQSLHSALLEVEELYLNNAVYFHHPKYVAHLNCPVTYPAVVAEQLLTAVNSSLDTWDQSATGTLIEQKLIDWTADKIGLGKQADGIFTSGGTQSNLMALLVARDRAGRALGDHDVRENGLPEQASKYRIFCSEVSHFSVQKSAALLGLGYNAVVSIPCDDQFKMDAHALTEQIESAKRDGLIPIAVVATMGTTDYGSIDPINEISELCKAHDMWCHVDAAYGCGLLLSQRSRELLNGIEKADSVTVDYHKSFMQPVSCSAFFLKDKSYFGLITHHADYLNPLDSRNDTTPNLVDKSIQTTRRFDALKLWVTLRTIGADGLGQMFDNVMSLAKQSYVLLNQDEEFDVIHYPEISTLVFRYTPSGVEEPLLNSLNNSIKEQLFASGEIAIARTKYKGVQYLKFTLLNPATTIEDIKEIVHAIKAKGNQILNQQETQTEVTA
ncbi:pyridoxal phosphate-dependent decarboxylase family protein [Thalassotalea euphylliae]|uniref:pyridoxal phosphate-dependent decarboxylase family protein n=1 Tax=Thalassotalea euphylliae TaxID=1655234 RepID=UPI00363A7160